METVIRALMYVLALPVDRFDSVVCQESPDIAFYAISFPGWNVVLAMLRPVIVRDSVVVVFKQDGNPSELQYQVCCGLGCGDPGYIISPEVNAAASRLRENLLRRDHEEIRRQRKEQEGKRASEDMERVIPSLDDFLATVEG